MIFKRTKKQSAYDYGKYSEWLACVYLSLKGYRLFKYNYLTKVGQVDFIFVKGSSLIFVEVKSRKNQSMMENLITNKQKRRLIKAANYFLSKNKNFSNKTIRFDAIYVIGLFRVTHFKNIFNDL